MADQQYTLERTAAPAEEPVTTAEAKAFGWVEHSTDDTLIGELITDARETLEELCGLAIVTQTWKQYLDCWPCSGPIIVPKVPLIAVSAITYVASDGTVTTWDSSYYQVDAKSRPARIQPAYSQSWPAHRWQLNAIVITFTAGFGGASSVPQKIKKRIAQAAKYKYDHRDDFDEDWLRKFLAQPWHGWIF